MVRFSTIGLLGFSICAVSAAENITEDAHFYGQSPPVYPSRM